MRSRCFVALLVAQIGCLLFFTQATLVAAPMGSSPRLVSITPRGVQRGQQHTLRFTGVRLSEAQQVFLYSAGTEVINIEQINDKAVDVTIAVDEDCRLGEHIAQLRTSRGISDFRSFFVGSLPHVQETEPNNSLSDSQHIEMNTSVLGTIRAEDVDMYQINCEKGERLNIEIEAIRLGDMFDPLIAILDEANNELAVADDSGFAAQDGVISMTVPETGKYYVLVREASFGGAPNSHYRLHVGNFPRPQLVFPPGGRAGAENNVTFLGDVAGPVSRTLSVPAEQPFRSGLIFTDDEGSTPTPVKFRFSDMDNFIELEPNNNRHAKMKTRSVPCAFNGVISAESDMDFHRFAGVAGTSYNVDCFARRIGSDLDPVINIFDSKGKRLGGADDTRRPDCDMIFKAPADGDYFVRVNDHLKRGNQHFIYRVEIEQAAPKLTVSVPRYDRYSQLRQQICVPRGNRFAVMLSAERLNFGGQLELLDADWPAGISVDTRPMNENMNLVPVVFSATADAQLAGQLVDLKMKHTDPQQNIVGSFSLSAIFALGEPNNSVYFSSSVDKLACAVTKPLPFKIDIVPPSVPVVRNGSSQLKIVATREEGFDKEIIVQFPFRPPGLGTKPQVLIKKGESEVYYPLNANGSATLGKWPVYAIAQAGVDGPVLASSQLVELEIAKPFVVAQINRTNCERGQSTNIHCKLDQLRKFEGEAVAELLGLPPHIETPKLKFTSDTDELNFLLQTSAKSPLGKHKGLFCRVTIVQNGEEIVSTAGRSELHITPSSGRPANKEPGKNKSKSRLQQLREQRKAPAEGGDKLP